MYPYRESTQPFQDKLQVCLNGHVINDKFLSSPEFNKKFCTECGQTTITQCPSCNADIPGDRIYPRVVDLGPTEPAPKICAECGQKFPWYEARIKQDSEAHERRRRKEEEKTGEQMSGTKRVEIRIEGHGNVLNMGNMIENVIANSIKLNAAGEKDIATALDTISKAIGEAGDIEEEKKKEYLEQLNTLSNEAVKPMGMRLPSSVLQPIIKYGLGGLSAIGSIAKIWSTWGPQIAHFFLGH